MSTPETRIVIAAGKQLLSANIATERRRVADVLNDQNFQCLSVQDVHVISVGNDDPEKVLSEALVPLSSINFVILTSEKHEAPDKRRYSLVEKRRWGVYLLLPDFSIEGHLSLAGRPEPRYALTVELSNFFAVTSANVTPGTDSAHCIQAPVVLVNKAKLSLFSLGGAIN
jgi:hypothetical protein